MFRGCRKITPNHVIRIPREDTISAIKGARRWIAREEIASRELQETSNFPLYRVYKLFYIKRIIRYSTTIE